MQDNFCMNVKMSRLKQRVKIISEFLRKSSRSRIYILLYIPMTWMNCYLNSIKYSDLTVNCTVYWRNDGSVIAMIICLWSVVFTLPHPPIWHPLGMSTHPKVGPTRLKKNNNKKQKDKILYFDLSYLTNYCRK